MTALLEVRALTKRFPSGDVGWLEVLAGVDLAVSRGEVVAIVGASGSGIIGVGRVLAPAPPR